MAYNTTSQTIFNAKDYSVSEDDLMAAIFDADLWRLQKHATSKNMLPNNICGLPVYAVAMLKLAELYQNINNITMPGGTIFLDMPPPLLMQTLVAKDILQASYDLKRTDFAYGTPIPVNIDLRHLIGLKNLCNKSGLDMDVLQSHTHVIFSQGQKGQKPFLLIDQFKESAAHAMQNPAMAPQNKLAIELSSQTILDAYKDNIVAPQEARLYAQQVNMLQDEGYTVYAGNETDANNSTPLFVKKLQHIYA